MVIGKDRAETLFRTSAIISAIICPTLLQLGPSGEKFTYPATQKSHDHKGIPAHRSVSHRNQQREGFARKAASMIYLSTNVL